VSETTKAAPCDSEECSADAKHSWENVDGRRKGFCSGCHDAALEARAEGCEESDGWHPDGTESDIYCDLGARARRLVETLLAEGGSDAAGVASDLADAARANAGAGDRQDWRDAVDAAKALRRPRLGGAWIALAAEVGLDLAWAPGIGPVDADAGEPETVVGEPDVRVVAVRLAAQRGIGVVVRVRVTRTEDGEWSAGDGPDVGQALTQDQTRVWSLGGDDLAELADAAARSAVDAVEAEVRA